MELTKYDVAIIGGGLGGLVSAVLLSSGGHKVVLIEEKEYPFHKVCGEYISNEVMPFLKSNDIFPEDLNPSRLSRLILSSPSGRMAEGELDLGGFGISRFRFDAWLATRATTLGAEVIHTRVSEVRYSKDVFSVTLAKHSRIEARLVIGAFGKRSSLDKSLSRRFIKKRSPFVGIKYHISGDFPQDLIALHNFPGGYCGVCRIEGDLINVCYLVGRKTLRNHKSIDNLEKQVLRQNPHLEELLDTCTRHFDKPLVINEVSFAKKEAVINHILMVGDSAGMIAPLCGNGMAMAIHGAKVGAEIANDFLEGNISRSQMERTYVREWERRFGLRLKIGRGLQGYFFGTTFSSEVGVSLMRNKWCASHILPLTHGKPF